MNTRRRQPCMPAAFALVEVLIAIFILAIGMVAVATIFPVAIHQSRQATDDVLGQMVGEQALALLRAKGLTGADRVGNPPVFVEDGQATTPSGLVEGFVDGSGRLNFNGEFTGGGSGAVVGFLSIPNNLNSSVARYFAIPGPEPAFITANEMVWPSVSGYPDINKPVKSRPLDFPEAERFPQYAWKVMLFKPEVSSPTTATILVYRVNNWDAFWAQQWNLVFPDFVRSKLVNIAPSHLVPGNIFIKSDGVLNGQLVDDLGTPWRITRTRRSDSKNPTQRFRDMLPDGAITDPTLGSQNVQVFHLPDTQLGRFRPVAVVTGTLD